MKRRVFWKILVGFWITSLLISQGVWLMFVLLRPQENETIDTAPFVSSAVTALLQREGGQKLRDDIHKWPNFWRKQVELTAAPAGAPGAIKGADGASYKILIHPMPVHHRHDHGPLDPPWQVVLVSIVGGLAFSGILAAYLTAPVARLRSGFRRLAAGDFAARLGPAVGTRRDEIADLAHDFDSMAERLQELVTHRDRLLAGVSHELRSPLARLQLAIGLAQKYPEKSATSLERISREANKLDEMVEELLTLSKLESGGSTDEEYFDLGQVVQVIADDAQFEGASRKISVVCDVQPDPGEDAVVAGSGKLVSQAVENIVRNALRFSTAGQVVKIAMASENESFVVTVQDEGPGVPNDQLEAVFKPFVQGSGGEGQGFGLGLAIAERAILAHAGSIVAANRVPRGLEIRITLPAAPRQP